MGVCGELSDGCDEESGRFTFIMVCVFLPDFPDSDWLDFIGSNISRTSLVVGLFKCSFIFFSILPPLLKVPGVEQVLFRFIELLKIQRKSENNDKIKINLFFL